MSIPKVSFGFAKIDKKPNLLTNCKIKSKSNVELIKCVEGKEIKLFNEKVEDLPLVIPMKECQKTSSALASLLKRRAVLLDEDEPNLKQSKTDVKNKECASRVSEPTTEETLDEKATRELLTESKSKLIVQESKNVLQIITANDLPLDGAKESTIDDYESVPVQQFGLALLRGMGWVDPPKKDDNKLIDDTMFVRPKGMGLGADKAIKAKPLLVEPEKNEILVIKKQAYVRILGGKFKDMYGQIEGFDDHVGRVIVKLAIGGTKEAFNEFLCQPVSKNEYAEYGKCINTAKYEKYKKLESEQEQVALKNETQGKSATLKKKLKIKDMYKEFGTREKAKIIEKEYDEKMIGESHKIERQNTYQNHKMQPKPSSSQKGDIYENSINIKKKKECDSSEKHSREYKKKHRSRSPTRKSFYDDSSSSSHKVQHSARYREYKINSDTSPEHSRYKKQCKQKKNKSKSRNRKRSRSSSISTTNSDSEHLRKNRKSHKKSKNKRKERYSRSRSK